MGAGKYDHIIQFQRFVLNDDGFQQVETWSDYGDPQRAERKDASDAEKVQASGLVASITSRFVIRSSTFTRTLTPKDRLTHEGATFEIFNIKKIGRRHDLEVTTGARIDK